MEHTVLRNGLEICKLMNGMWQVSGAHGNIDRIEAVKAMLKYTKQGYTTFDMADIYGPAESIYGQFLKAKSTTIIKEIQAFTKFVPRPGPMTEDIIKTAIKRSISRMRVKKLDGLQFHWWNYDDKRYLDALQHLSALQQLGLIGELSLTNFDTKRMKEISALGIDISTNQVQYSIIDTRAEILMAKHCQKHNIKLLTYGTLCGGLLTDKYLGKPEPNGRQELYTASLGKYKYMIDAWGGWLLFQELLRILRTIADKYGVDIATVATRYILDQPFVGAVIIGCRFGVDGCDHANKNLKVFDKSWCLTHDDVNSIMSVTLRANDLMHVIGDCGSEYR